VGDSHPYGAGVDATEAYPAQLQRFLDERAPGVWSVLNLGVPGMTTAHVVRALPEQLARLRPDVVVVWAGVNDIWRYDREGDESAGRLQALLARSRVVRLFRVALHERRIEGVRDRAGQLIGDRDYSEFDGGRLAVDVGGRREVAALRGRHSDDGAVALTRGRYLQMIMTTRAHGVRLMLVTYPQRQRIFAQFSDVVRELAATARVPFVDGTAAMERLPPAERRYVYKAHPGPEIYREIARDLAALLAEDATAAAAAG
jgi:lysophospholipase L1-like esterase